ncbi:MAG: YaaL family protein [Clostridium sp.]|uniref:DUF2508 family protein n=1 Tax=Clostridium sp. DSM 8431 TaxID=1761781 RepID=UPI0008E20B9E|nr:DUF2508 family protein [Clostridium sp. DSM 8431]MCR4943258.1 YaaL family protein [Clostridium sp.]SFU74282.1 Protein of unknown function [Clostridium sp. DSM 8431]
MNKLNILEYILKLIRKDVQEDSELISEIEYALIEIDTAKNIFNNVSDSNLIEVAIYSEDAATRRFEHLLKKAKEEGISVSKAHMIDKYLEIAE